MIPGAFAYHRPADLAAAVQMLTDLGEEARVVAGGHSLIPMMKLRMATPEHLIDLQDVGELGGISVDNRSVRIGAMATQHELIASDELAAVCPILRETALQIADPQVRYVGTLGGNIANGDPGNDMPALMQCLDADYVLAGPGGERTVKAREFYEGAFFTARADDEILVRASFTAPDAGTGWAYEKQKRKIGDYATAAAAVLIGNGLASIALTNLADAPIWVADASSALAGGDVDGAVTVALAAIDPVEDNRGPVEFKMHVAGVVLRRAISRAQSRAG